MLVKEYRICLPMSVEEYRIAQLYMIQKKSRDESSGSGSGVEILVNEPYENGPGGNGGQYTHKIYHIGSHLPGWFRAILPKSALIVEEKAWNAYPYTKTIYKCPFIEKFMLEIETVYHNDGGVQENVFNLSKTDLRSRTVDVLDIVTDPISAGDYREDEDPKLFQSQKTGRGPLSDGWRNEYTLATCDSTRKDTANSKKIIMCAYKLCKVEFRYWGMQSRIEGFIHDIGLRKTMLRAHRQAWCWQDEYYGLTMADIRRLELETQRALKDKMAAAEVEESAENNEDEAKENQRPTTNNSTGTLTNFDPTTRTEQRDQHGVSWSSGPVGCVSGSEVVCGSSSPVVLGCRSSYSRLSYTSARSRLTDMADWQVDGLERLQTSSSDDEFFDAAEESMDSVDGNGTPLLRSTSMELMTVMDENDVDQDQGLAASCPAGTFHSSPSRPDRARHKNYLSPSTELSVPRTPTSPSTVKPCRTTTLFLLIHGGSVVDTGEDPTLSKLADLSTFRSTVDAITRAHYPSVVGHVAIRLVSCPPVCAETIKLLSSLNPYHTNMETSTVAGDNFPLSAVALFATGSPDYNNFLSVIVSRINSVYNEFLRSEDGCGFSGQVCFIADCVGSIIAYDILCSASQPNMSFTPDISTALSNEMPKLFASQHSTIDFVITEDNVRVSSVDGLSPRSDIVHGSHLESPPVDRYFRHSSCPVDTRTPASLDDFTEASVVFNFEVSEFFMLGSPLGLVLAYRRLCEQRGSASNKTNLLRPLCHQIYNLYYSSDPSALRLEPLIHPKFTFIAPIKLPRYSKFPFGDGLPIHTVETLQAHRDLLLSSSESPPRIDLHSSLSCEPNERDRRPSNQSNASQMSGQADLLNTSSISAILGKWWGNKRLDYAIYCPEALQNFPSAALPNLLHASFWESTDIVAFILRQVVQQEYLVFDPDEMNTNVVTFRQEQPREKWLKRRTTIKLRNVAPNHRANDVIVLDSKPQILTARLMYGPLDVVSLSGEKVDIHIMMQPPASNWVLFGTEFTDTNGRATYQIPEDKRLPEGLYPVKMVVRGDHTSVDFYIAVVPPKTAIAIFSIDGSFAASVSIMAKDPKVRAGAVDVVRHWQELGYMVLYVTARPDMQQRRVVRWLAEHNFPHGMVAFMDGLSADPLRQKAVYLKQLVNEAQLDVHVAYGSSKDITVYQSLGLEPHQIFVVGKVSKKHQKEAVIISSGYAVHLTELSSMSTSRPVQHGNFARFSLRKGCFALPNQRRAASAKAPVCKTTSLPQRMSFREQSSHPSPAINVSMAGNTGEKSAGEVDDTRSGSVNRSRRSIDNRNILQS